MNLYLSTLTIAVSIGAASAVIGAVYVLILTTPGHILESWSSLLYRAMEWIVSKTTKEDWIITKRRDYWLKPILTCELCVSGQIALWTYLFTQPFHIFGLIFCICQSILTAWLIARLMKL